MQQLVSPVLEQAFPNICAKDVAVDPVCTAEKIGIAAYDALKSLPMQNGEDKDNGAGGLQEGSELLF